MAFFFFFCILIAWITLGKSQALYLTIPLQMHSTVLNPLPCRVLQERRYWNVAVKNIHMQNKTLYTVGPFLLFLQLKMTLWTICLEYRSNKSVLYMLFYFLEAGGKGGVMHSPVAHVLYLCYPEMKHLCGDGFFTA